jgi:hypothetical protein
VLIHVLRIVASRNKEIWCTLVFCLNRSALLFRGLVIVSLGTSALEGREDYQGEPYVYPTELLILSQLSTQLKVRVFRTYIPS